MRNRIIALFLFLIIIFSLQSCGLGNSDLTMSYVLSEKDAYIDCMVYIKDIEYGKEFSTFRVGFDNVEKLSCFYDVSTLNNSEYKDIYVDFILPGESEEYILYFGFFEKYCIGDNINLKVSNYEYKGKYYFYIASIVYNGEEFLPFDLGIEYTVNYLSR